MIHLLAWIFAYHVSFKGAAINETHHYKLMTVTRYSELDSCHNRTKDGCLVAQGILAQDNGVACPPEYPFGTEFSIDNIAYFCNDRYSKRLSPRLDLWTGYGEKAHEEAIQFGVQYKMVKLP